MLDDTRPILGAGGGGGKGGGSGRSPTTTKDNLRATSTARVIDLLSEGEIGGWEDPENPGQCIFFDDTPLQNSDGSFNFEGVEYWLRTGEPDQDPVPGFSAVESEVGVGVTVPKAQPVARSISDPDIDAVRIKVGVQNLSEITDDGDQLGTRVEFAIEIQAGTAGWQLVGEYAFDGKTTSGYQRAYRVELPSIRPVSIRVRRITDDSTNDKLQNEIGFISFTEIIDAKFAYPNSAYVALAIDAAAFGGRIPRRSYKIKGIMCWVPSNYDPVARTYDESSLWDGTFKRAATNNPAFFTYTVLVENRWGLGERISPELNDKWAFYQIGKYCDGQVDDGLGGLEPRFTINGVINTREAAYEVITRLSAAFRGVTYWGAGAVVPVADMPSDPIKLVVNASVVGGEFNYSGTALASRKNAAVGSYRHPDDHFKLKPGVLFEDHGAIARDGRRQTEVSMPFTTSRGEALRNIKWLVDTDQSSIETVNYQAGLDHASIRPGDKILISDKHRIMVRAGGRLKGIASDRLSVALDAPVSIIDGESYELLVSTKTGGYLTVGVDAPSADSTLDLSLSSALPGVVVEGAKFALASTDTRPRLFRVVSNTEEEKHLFNVTALLDDPDKFARVEQGISVQDDDPHIIPARSQISAPSGLSVQAFVRPDPGSKSKLRLLASWSPSGNPLVALYNVRLKEPNSAWRDVETTSETSLEITPRRDDAGIYQVRVSAVSLLGESSPFAAASVENSNVFPRPATPEGWQGEAGHDSITLWGSAHPAPDFKAFVVYGATADAPDLLRLDEITTTRYVRRVLAGATITRYAVTALNHSGEESFPTAFITVSPSPPGLIDLAAEVGEAIGAAQEAAGGAASDATHALSAAEAAQDNLAAVVGGYSGTLSDLETGHQIATQAVADAQAARDDADGFATSAEESNRIAALVASGNLAHDPSAAGLAGWSGSLGGVLGFVTHGQPEPYSATALRVVMDAEGDGGCYTKEVVTGPLAGRTFRLTFKHRSAGGNGNLKVSVARKQGPDGALGFPGATYNGSGNAVFTEVVAEIPFADTVVADRFRPRVYMDGLTENDWFEITDLVLEDVTNLKATVEARDVAVVKADEAGVSAAAAATEAAEAATQAGVSSAQRALAVSAKDAAEEASNSAAQSLSLAAQTVAKGGGVLKSQYLESSAWGDYINGPTRVPNELYPQGKTFVWSYTTSKTSGISLVSSSAEWVGQQNAQGYVIEIDFTLVNGGITAAGLLFDWEALDGADNRVVVELPDMLAGPVTYNEVTTARVVVQRPDPYVGAFSHNRVWFMANWAGFSSGSLSSGEIRVHRIGIRPALAEEMGGGRVGAAFNAKLTQDYQTATTTNMAVAQVRTEMESKFATAGLNDDMSDKDYWVAGFNYQEADRATAASFIDAYAEATQEIVAGEGAVFQLDGNYRVMSERRMRPFVPGQKWRVRIRTRMTIDATDFFMRVWIVSVNAAGAYSGYDEILTEHELTVADGWTEFETEFTPTDESIYTADGGVKWALMLGYNGGVPGPGIQQISHIRLEDVSLVASVRDNAYTVVQADQAIAGAVTSYDAQVTGGLAATVTQTATTLADVDGYLAAQASLTAELSNGKISGIRATVHDGAGGASSGALLELIGDDVVAEGTLSTSRLVVSDFSGNVWPTGFQTFGDTRGYNSLPSDFTIAARQAGSFAALAAAPTPYVVRCDPVTSERIWSVAEELAVQPGERYVVRCAAATGGSGTNPKFRLVVSCTDADGAFVGGSFSDFAPIYTAWNDFEKVVVIPAGAAFANLSIRRQANQGEQNVFITNIAATRQRDGAVLITPGSITAASGLIAEATIGAAEIASLAVDTLHIKDQAVTIPVSVYQSGNLDIPGDGGWHDVTSVTMDREGFATYVLFTAQLRGEVGGSAILFRLLRDGTEVRQFHKGLINLQDSIAYGIEDSDTGTGVTTFKIQAKSNNTAPRRVHQSSMRAQQTKK